MIKLVLKHWIYEKCINILFDNLYKNFKYDKCFKTNIIYKKIIIRQKLNNGITYVLYNATIKEIFDKNIIVIIYDHGYIETKNEKIHGKLANKMIGFVYIRNNKILKDISKKIKKYSNNNVFVTSDYLGAEIVLCSK